MQDEQLIHHRKLTIGHNSDGYAVTLELTIQENPRKAFTVDLEPITNYHTLAICG